MLEEIVVPLLEWYDRQKRTLPWRSKPTPYRVWVSEIMLQQTRVEAVKPYFERFMKALPNVKKLAACPEEELLKLWEGLGYYNRVRNMQKAAQILVKENKGEIPAHFEELIKLPGIGKYTAGAISSIAFGIPVPAVDGNVLRVITRITADERDIAKDSVKQAIARDVQEIIPMRRAGDFNQALIELGAIVCVPNGPAKCSECPVAHLCEARKKDIVTELPKKAAKKARTIERKTVLLIKDGDKVAIRKRPKKGLLAGLYELPNVEGELSEDEVLELVKSYDLAPLFIQKLEDSKHIFTHKEWHMCGYAVRVEELETDTEEMLFVERETVEKEYPIPSAFAAYAKHMNIVLGNKK
jgi:A/G-specific adenine glycosylase